MSILRRTRLATVVAMTVAALAVTGCTAGAATMPAATTPSPATRVVALGFTPGTAAHPRVVVITASDQLIFVPSSITVARGETVTFQIKNVGTVAHEFKIGPMTDAFADKQGTPEVAGIAGGTTKSLTFTFSGPGPYAFACHEPGHYEAGMKGTITLVNP